MPCACDKCQNDMHCKARDASFEPHEFAGKRHRSPGAPGLELRLGGANGSQAPVLRFPPVYLAEGFLLEPLCVEIASRGEIGEKKGSVSGRLGR